MSQVTCFTEYSHIGSNHISITLQALYYKQCTALHVKCKFINTSFINLLNTRHTGIGFHVYCYINRFSIFQNFINQINRAVCNDAIFGMALKTSCDVLPMLSENLKPDS